MLFYLDTASKKARSMNKMPVTVLQRLLHVLVINFAKKDCTLLSILKFCNCETRFDFMTKKSTTYIEIYKHPEHGSV